MLRCKFAVQLTQGKRFAGAVEPLHGLEFSTSHQTGRCRVSFRHIGWTVPSIRTLVDRSAAAEIISGKVLFAFLKDGPVPVLELYSDPTNSITTPGTAIRRVR